MNIKLLCVYHKPAPLLKNDAVVPVHAGRALLDDKVRAGVLKSEEAQWMRTHLLGDDTGDNISAENPYLNETTVIYWAWKNYDKLGNPDFIGLMHYRRQFWFKTDMQAPDYLSAIGCDGTTLQKKLPQYAFVTLPFVTLEHAPDVLEFFRKPAGGSTLLEDTLNKLYQTDPANAQAYWTLARGRHTGGMRNMFILPREEFFRYCAWLFGLILPLTPQAREKERYIGTVSEILCGLYTKRLAQLYPAHLQADVLDYEDLAFPAGAAARCKELRRRAGALLAPAGSKYKRAAAAQRLRNRYWKVQEEQFKQEGPFGPAIPPKR